MSRLSIMPAATIILPLPPVVAGAAAQGSPAVPPPRPTTRLPAATATAMYKYRMTIMITALKSRGKAIVAVIKLIFPLIRKGCRLSRLNPAALCTKTAMAITANRLMAIFIFINKPILSYWGVTYAIYLIRTTPPGLNYRFGN